jgi:hypothetical protein
MAWYYKEMYPRRPGKRGPLCRLRVLAVLYYQGIVRYQVLQDGDQLGEVRTWNLYLFHFIKVRPCPIGGGFFSNAVSDEEVSNSQVQRLFNEHGRGIRMEDAAAEHGYRWKREETD